MKRYIVFLLTWALSVIPAMTLAEMQLNTLSGRNLANLDTLSTNVAAAATTIMAVQQTQQSGIVGYQTGAAMNADLSPPDGTLAIVTNDPSIDNNIWIKLGASSSGFWKKLTMPSTLPLVDARKYANFEAAITAQEKNPATLVISTPMPLTTTIVMPDTLQLMFIGGGYISVSGNGAVIGLKEARPEWFGALGNDTGDDSVAINRAIASSNNIRLTGIYRVTQPVKILRNGVHVTSESGAYIHGFGAINIVELGDGRGPDLFGNHYTGIYGGSWDCSVLAGDALVMRGIYGRGVREYHFGYKTNIQGIYPKTGFTIAGVEMRNGWTQNWYGGQTQYSAGHGFYLNNVDQNNNNIRFFGTKSAHNGGTAFLDTGGAGRTYNVYAEDNAAGGLSLSSVRGFDISGGYYETNIGYDIKIDGASTGGSVGGNYFTHAFANGHKMIWLALSGGVNIGTNHFGFAGDVKGGSAIYMDKGSGNVTTSAGQLVLEGGSTGTLINGPNKAAVSIKSDSNGVRFPLGVTGDINAAGTAYNPVKLNSGLIASNGMSLLAFPNTVLTASGGTKTITISGPLSHTAHVELTIVYASSYAATTFKRYSILFQQTATSGQFTPIVTLHSSDGTDVASVGVTCSWLSSGVHRITVTNSSKKTIGAEISLQLTGYNQIIQ